MTFTDEQLQDYLSGQLDADTSTMLEQSIAEDQDLEDRILVLERAGSAALRDAIQSMPIADRLAPIQEGLPLPGSNTITPATRSRWPGAIAAAVAAAVVAGVLLINGPVGPNGDRWQDQVAIYQALYVTDTLAPVQADPGDVEDQLIRSAEALGRPLPLDAVGDLDGLPLLRAQILGFDEKPLIQMAYLTEEGVPVALCAIKLGSDTNGVVSETLTGLASVHWSDGAYSYMIVGDIAPDRLLKMASDVQGLL